MSCNYPFIYLLKEWLSDGILVEVVSDVGVEQTTVPVICHMTSIVDRSYQELDRLPRRFIILVQIQAQQVLGHLSITITQPITATVGVVTYGRTGSAIRTCHDFKI